MRTYDEAYAAALDKPAFSNGTEWDVWSSEWCSRCVNDTDDNCPLILVAMMGRTPSEWFEQPRGERGLICLEDRYHCVEFRDEDDPGGREPEPLPDPPGQEVLFDRDEWTRPGRLLSQPELTGVTT